MTPAGYFRSVVYLLPPVEAATASGQPRLVYGAERILRLADVVPQGSAEFIRSTQQTQEGIAVYRIRGHVAVNLKYRLEHLGRVFEVVRIETTENRPPEQADLISITVKGPV